MLFNVSVSLRDDEYNYEGCLLGGIGHYKMLHGSLFFFLRYNDCLKKLKINIDFAINAFWHKKFKKKCKSFINWSSLLKMWKIKK